jgi:Subtilase family
VVSNLFGGGALHNFHCADTGFDTNIPSIRAALRYEVCLLDWSACPNGTGFQEGSGSAHLPQSLARFTGASHGTQMASIAVETNPQLKVVLIRLIAYSERGQRLPVFDSTVVKALRWISEHASEFNIGAVAMAQGHHGLLSQRDYCPKNPELEKVMTQLRQRDIPVFLPTGNAGDKSRIDWPACIPVAMAIGAINPEGSIAKYSNHDSALNDFFAPGTATALLPGGLRSSATGTSVATLIAASHWMRLSNTDPTLTTWQISQLIRESGPIVFDAQFKFGRKIDIEAALLQREKVAA